MSAAQLILPPLLTPQDIETHSPLDTACAGAAARQLGAGDVLWGRNPARAELAIVLEPEVQLTTALQMLYVAMAACGDCLGALTPPQVAVMFRWPDVICVNGAQAGRVRLFVPDTAQEGTVPDWLVVGVDLRLAHEQGDPEPGHTPDLTTLEDEGCADLTAITFMESYCRHFLTWLHKWQTEGFTPVRTAWKFRAEGQDGPVKYEYAGQVISGEFADLDQDGNLTIKSSGKPVTLPLINAVPRWPDTRQNR